MTKGRSTPKRQVLKVRITEATYDEICALAGVPLAEFNMAAFVREAIARELLRRRNARQREAILTSPASVVQ